MGLTFVLLFWIFAGCVVAAIGSTVFGVATWWLTRGVQTGRRTALVAVVLFPPVCLAWAGAVFVFQAIVNEAALHRDLGLGDTWHAPLPNGYQIMMIDVTDQGWVYNPKTQIGSGVIDRGDAIPGVRDVELSGHYILGATDSKAFEHVGDTKDQVDGYFILDTDLGKRTEFQTYDALRRSALQIGIEPNLQPINAVYSKYRFSWFDVFAGLLFCVPPIVGILFLAGWIIRLRRGRQTVLGTV